MKVYQVFDDCTLVLSTCNRLEALEALYKLTKKHTKTNDYFWVDELEI